MNRLIIIGNGFDLAHGHKTSYTDFITDYIRKSYLNTLETPQTNVDLDNRYYETYAHYFDNELIHINLKDKYTNIDYTKTIVNCKNLIELKDISNRYKFNRRFKSEFIKSTIDHCENYNWVDIENEYFQHLLIFKNTYLKEKEKNSGRKMYSLPDLEELENLNQNLNHLTKALGEYLESLKTENTVINNQILKIFRESITKDEIVTTNLNYNTPPKNIYFLNFNYTSTLLNYQKRLTPSTSSLINHIHGELNSNINPMIFGFGDEIDKSYQEIEELNENEFFKHIKSFKYFKTSKYHDLIRFTESDDFQVYIIGHSCGLSDRTLLNHIFEHEKCKSIKIFYHQRPDGTNDYIEKTFDISRHFRDKGIMRKKIVPFEKSQPIPQITT